MRTNYRVKVTSTDPAHRVPRGACGRIVGVSKGAAADGSNVLFVRFSYTAIPGVYYDSFLPSQIRRA